MYCGGGLGGFIATKDEPKFTAEFPSLLFGITTTTQPGEYGFGEVLYERTSYASRDKAKDSSEPWPSFMALSLEFISL